MTSTFHQLQNNLHGYDNVLTFRTALGAAKGTGRMVLEGSHDMFFLLNTSRDVAVSDKSPVEEVSLDTLDGFCLDHNITHINYLKIDTEGGDMDVLRGAENILTRQQVDVVEVEAGMNIRNRRHVPFAALSKFFEEENYFLFGVYEQVNEWPTKEPHLRRTNPVFISDRVIKANAAAPCRAAVVHQKFRHKVNIMIKKNGVKDIFPMLKKFLKLPIQQFRKYKARAALTQLTSHEN